MFEPQLYPVNDGGGDDYDFSGATFIPAGDDYGGGGGEGGPDTVAPADAADHAAIDAQVTINSAEHHNSREFLILVYRGSNGTMHKSHLIGGTGASVSRSQIETWMTAHGVSMGQVVGFVHNHDQAHYSDTVTEELMNRYPSGGDVDGGDWNVADSMVARGAGGATGSSGFSMYVIDTHGELREFQYSNRSTYMNLNADERERGVALPPELVSNGS